MQHRIGLQEAHRRLSRYVELASQGDEVILTRRGKPVARLVPFADQRELTPEQSAALERTRERMRRGYDLGGRMPSRDELRER